MIVWITIYSYFENFSNIGSEFVSYVLPNGAETNNSPRYPTDPKVWWPQGLPQGTAPVAAALITYRALHGAPTRLRVLASLGALGVSGTGITFHAILSQPIGFNRLAWGVSEWRRTGSWPNFDSPKSEFVEKWADNMVSNASPDVKLSAQAYIEEAGKHSKQFLPGDLNILDYCEKIVYYFMDSLSYFFKPEIVKGTLGDLLGQQFMIYILLTITVISLILLFISYIINITILLAVIQNKEKILNKFNFKLMDYYIKYQTFLIKVSLIYIPLFIFAGLFILLKGMHYLITHPIPLEILGIDMNTFLESLPNSEDPVSTNTYKTDME